MPITIPSNTGDPWTTQGPDILTALNNFENTGAQYDISVDQVITTGTNAVVAFATATTTSPLVTRSTDGVGHRFTLGRAGLWIFTSTIRFRGGTGGERYAGIEGTPGGLSAVGYLLGTNNGPVTLDQSVCRYMNLNDYVRVTVFQSSSGNQSLESGTPSWARINLAWMHA